MRKLTWPAIIILLFAIALPLANAINPVGLPQFSYDSSNGTSSVTLTVQSTSNSENGLFELQMYSGYPAQAIIIGNPTTCDPSKPYQKAVPYQFSQEIGNTKTITINDDNIPDGDYTPMLVHVTGCCSSGCKALQPFGWGWPLTSDKITFKKTQIPTDKSGLTPSQVDFQLSNLKLVTPLDIFKNNGFPLGVRFLKAAKSQLGDVFAITIKNTGSLTSGAQLEAYYVSKTNPFYSVASSSFNSKKLQSFYGQEGITQNPQTCKNEVGASYSLDLMIPQESKTVYLFAPYPSKGDNLAGNDNYNPKGEYLLVVDIYDTCQNPNIYSITGGTLNFNVDSNSNIVKDGAEVNKTSLDKTLTYQKTIKKDDLQKTTAMDLLKSACSTDDVCEPTAQCQSIQSLIDSGSLTDIKAKSDITTQQHIIADTLGLTVGGIGAATIGTAEGLAICSAFAAGTSGFGFPICLGVLASGGAILGGTLGDSFFKIFKSIDQSKLNEAGYCVPRSDDSFTFTSAAKAVGNSVNSFFGSKKVEDFTLGVIIFIVIIFFIILRATS